MSAVPRRAERSRRPRAAAAATAAVIAAIAAAALSTACASPDPPETQGSASIRIVGLEDQALVDRAFGRLAEIEAALSGHVSGSEISRVNAAAGISPVAVGGDALAVVTRDLEYARLSGGAFDPTVGPLVRLWGIGTKDARLPAPSEIRGALALTDWRDVVVDPVGKTIFLRRPGMALDLGSATKGYAADAVASILRGSGVRKALIDLGGNILVMGTRADGKSWRIGLQDPFKSRGSMLGVASLEDESMVTSGIYERYYEEDGRRYHHILDTSTGYPADKGLVSATVIAPKSFDADGLTTAILALGRERGMELAKERGVGAILVDADRRVYLSPGLSRKFEITDPAFAYAE